MREIPSERLNEKIKKVWRITGLIGTFFLALVTFGPLIILTIFFDVGPLSFIIPSCIILFWRIPSFLFFPRVRYARWRYELLPDEIDIMEGLFFITRTIIPMVRVQFTDTTQGPIMRAFGLSSVKIVTAGGEKVIPGLTSERAEYLRDKIADLAKIAKEDV
ncbi:MAG: PH domain-containing protein [Clostridiales Family XIII bacterium]|jgi:membrane protein YdbS with pleckstrin-like domain|nr:PH domain-containing protein [Clostridiales Family XIII bacterium]